MVLLAAANAKYIHTSLALYALRSFCRLEFPGIRVEEFNINQHMDWVLNRIYLLRPRVAAFSVNIWNLHFTLELADRLKKVAPGTVIVLGGPEAGAAAAELMAVEPAIDYIVRGEGEETFRELLGFLLKGEGSPENIRGLVFREGEEVRVNPPRPPLEEWPFPYEEEELAAFGNRLVYYESSRGCLFNCAYCLSGWEKTPVRYLPLERVKKDLTRFIEAGTPVVKLVDRTFNLDRERAMALLEFMADRGEGTVFHLEMVGELMDREMIDFLNRAPAGRFRLEIGVQTTCRAAARAVNRFYSPEKLGRNIRRLVEGRKVFLHLDLLAGLPGEDPASLAKSFDWTYRLQPDEIQLGFLKLLKGSPLREKAAEYGYQFTRVPPYEILANRWLSYNDLRRLKIIEEILGKYYNSRRFCYTLAFLRQKAGGTPWEFYNGLAAFWEEKGLAGKNMKPARLYEILWAYLQTLPFFHRSAGALRDLLTLDFYLAGGEGSKTPWRPPDSPEWQEKFRQMLQEDGYRRSLPEPLSGYSPRELQRRGRLLRLSVDPETLEAREVMILVYLPAQGRPFWRRLPAFRPG